MQNRSVKNLNKRKKEERTGEARAAVMGEGEVIAGGLGGGGPAAALLVEATIGGGGGLRGGGEGLEAAAEATETRGYSLLNMYSRFSTSGSNEKPCSAVVRAATRMSDGEATSPCLRDQSWT